MRKSKKTVEVEALLSSIKPFLGEVIYNRHEAEFHQHSNYTIIQTNEETKTISMDRENQENSKDDE